jgi:hypothetical protein
MNISAKVYLVSGTLRDTQLFRTQLGALDEGIQCKRKIFIIYISSKSAYNAQL